ncbi:MAG: AAA family ATPase [candidate division NC10 bacterium]|nr:AAA family ATPase [candidate division NC10 bacterium]
MICPNCQHENSQAAKFCEECGTKLIRACPGCGHARLQHRVGARHAVPLRVRVGIHTGLVVVGEMGGGDKHEHLALGETPNLAARVQGIAEPDTVVISAATYRLVQGLFACQVLGVHPLQGLSQPMALYRVLRETGAQSRLEVAGPTGLTPLVGREQEVGLLLERWAQVKDGVGQVVVLSGEPGIGKSRLVQVVKDRVVGEPHIRLECRGSPYYQNSALYPVIDLLQRVLQFRQDEAPHEKLRKLEEALGVGAGLKPAPTTEAEICFRQAIEIARRQQAKSLELRAVMSLSRLWQKQGKREDARQMLAELYGWFTEGFDTADWQEATALLEAFS